MLSMAEPVLFYATLQKEMTVFGNDRKPMRLMRLIFWEAER